MAAGERIAELDDYYASHPKQAADTFNAEFTANAGYRAPTIVDLFSLNVDPAVLAMREQVREQLDVWGDTFRYNYFAHWAKGKN